MASATYRLIRKAILAEQQITCHYNGHYRELCPHILGHTDSEETAGLPVRRSEQQAAAA